VIDKSDWQEWLTRVIDKSEWQSLKQLSGSEITNGGTVNEWSEVQPEKHCNPIIWISSWRVIDESEVQPLKQHWGSEVTSGETVIETRGIS
jgi:hypothetical protein